MDPEGGGVVVEVVGGGEADGGALHGRRDDVDDGAAEGQTGALVRRRERFGGAALDPRAHDETLGRQSGGGLGPRDADHVSALLPGSGVGAAVCVRPVTLARARWAGQTN